MQAIRESYEHAPPRIAIPEPIQYKRPEVIQESVARLW
jgi:hypothetical protein